MASQKDFSDRWLVVGAGPSGLTVALAMRRAGLPFDAVEAGDKVGGLWNMDNPGSAIYESAHFISSASRSGWADLPMPDHYPTYPRWWEIRDYIQAWAAHHDLVGHYEFETRVDSAEPVETGAGERWDVVLQGGERRRYRGVLACPGFQRVPNVPSYPGVFSGSQRHSQTYRRADEFRGKRVLIVGAGNSAVDIACDAAVTADRAVISTRRGYWFMPKLVGGVPFDCWAVNSASSQERLGKFLAIHAGDPSTVGFGEPDHAAMAHHPILNDQALHHLAHGDLLHRPEIERIDGSAVHFVDGSIDEFDEIIWATGFKDQIPFVAEKHCRLSAVDTENDLFLWMFHRRHPHFAVLGPANLAAGGYWGLAAAADMIVGHLLDETTDPDSWRRFREVVEGPEPDLTGGYDYYQKPGHLNYVNAHALDEYGVQLAGEFGFEPLAMPTDFEPPELLDVDAWLDDPGPVRHPPDGSLAPIPYDPEAIIHG
ncbi:MAG: NAD(P)/FAD-dependent oxidoreductase [Actinobacteria bacterium]|jgi:cation diffusion facilitator CzcD-associated flavoprotein CzcO|nr:NAD(P)/FAD-dependent oxidoreductase [Actinomycetota bacterium]